jgi:hypothetical protein
VPAGVPTKSGAADHWRPYHHRAWHDHHPIRSAIAKTVTVRPGAATSGGMSVETCETEKCSECCNRKHFFAHLRWFPWLFFVRSPKQKATYRMYRC